MKIKKVISILLASLMICLMSSTAFAAKKGEGGKKVVDGDVNAQALITQEIYFMDKNKNKISTYTRDSEPIYIRGEQEYASTVLADGCFEMLVDPKFAKPTFVSTNLPQNSFVYEYNSNFGGYCYHYDSGVFWYFPAVKKYLEVKTSTAYPGTHKAMVGTDWLIGDPWATSYLQVK